MLRVLTNRKNHMNHFSNQFTNDPTTDATEAQTQAAIDNKVAADKDNNPVKPVSKTDAQVKKGIREDAKDMKEERKDEVKGAVHSDGRPIKPGEGSNY